MVETGEGSNTAITAQLISIGVTERISVTPSMFTQAGRESSSKKQCREDGGGKAILHHTVHSFGRDVHLNTFVFGLIYVFCPFKWQFRIRSKSR